MELIRQLRLALLLFLAVLATGTLGYILIEGWTLREALYMTIITVTTVGYSEVNPLSAAGEYFTMFVALAGAGTAFYLLLATTEYIVEGHLRRFLTERKMERDIKKLKDHYILCGYSLVGENVAEEFEKSKTPFVVVESNPERLKDCLDRGYYCIEGDASSKDVLYMAGVDRARGLVAAFDSDADNVFVVLTARVLNKNLIIVAQSVFDESREKLLHAGANRVVSPSSIGGKRMAAMLLRPLVSEYIDVVSLGDEIEFRLEGLEITKDSSVRGKTIGEADIRERTGAVILAVKKKTGDFNTAPTSKTVLEESDELVVLGTQDQLEAVNRIV